MKSSACFFFPALRRTAFALIGLVLVLLGCKSAGKAYKSGNYYDAVMMAVRKLKDSPGHSSSIEILTNAYPKAVSEHLGAAKKLESNKAGFYWEQMVEHYGKLNQMYEGISQCTSCLNLVEAKSYEREELRAREMGAEARYREGEKYLAQGGRENARQAHSQFEAASRLKSDYRDVDSKLNRAFELATFKVVVEQVLVTSKAYQLSNAYFQERINEFLRTDSKINRYVRFYTPEEAEAQRLKPDHIVVLQFDDFVVGQTMVERNTETVTSKDSVKVGETKVRGQTQPVYGKVTAKFTHSKKTVVSQGLLDMQIKSFGTGEVVHRDKMPGQYTWYCEWGTFTGDERALTQVQKGIAKQKELMPPPPQDLFVEFSKPIYDQLTRKLRNFYNSY